MKQRLLEAIYKKIDDEPNNENLQKQIMLLNRAHISTIHSFCLDVIRNNFFEIGMPANFRVADQSEIEIIKQDIIEEIFEQKYEEQNLDFMKLLETYTTYKDDTPLKDIVLGIYEFTRCLPEPEIWLHDRIEEFNANTNLNETKYGKILIIDAKNQIKYMLQNLQNAKMLIDKNIELNDFCAVIENDLSDVDVVFENNWDSIYDFVNTKVWQDWPRKSKMSEEAKELKNRAKEYRDEAKSAFEKLTKYMIGNEKDLIEDMRAMYPILRAVESLLLEFSQKFSNAKKEKNIVDFTDIEHLALHLLIDKDGKPTEIAKKYDFEEIAIDEYQDSNLVQEKILTSVSNGNNIFMVGDVKQSIYRFRQARPDLFLEKYQIYKKIEEKELLDNSDKDNLLEDTKIQLYNNFRSRKEVLDITNLIFQNIMSKELGEIEYSEEEYLNFSAKFEESKIDCTTELCLIELEAEEGKDNQKDKIDNSSENVIIENSEEAEILEKTVLEARLVAKKINELVLKGYKYKDMAILLRSPNMTAPIYEKELIEQGIPVFSDTSSQYLETIEIDTIISLLKIIDNPLQDIPLVTVLRSQIAGFTDNELLEIRLKDRNCPFFKALQKASSEYEENLTLRDKVSRFLQMLEDFKTSEKELPLDELIWKIYSDTGYYHYVRLMPNGKLRQANLKKLFEKAKDYEKISFKGLFNFITFIEKIAEKPNGMQEAKIIGENEDVVRIMSIHKSKGLEFPICFLCEIEKKINLRDLNEKIIYDQDIGLGINYINEGIEYSTLSKEAIKLKLRKEAISEEMRVLYVALTRAKEKLILIGADKKIEEGLEKKAGELAKYEEYISQKISPKLIEKYIRYLDWLELVYEHNNGKYLKLEIIDKNSLNEGDSQKEEIDVIELLNNIVVEKEKYEEVDKLLNWKYQYEKAIDAPSKTSVTALKNSYNGEFYNSSNNEIDLNKNIESLKEDREDFKKKLEGIEDNKIEGAKLGSLIHLALQNVEIDKNNNNIRLEDIKEKSNIDKIKVLIDNLKITKEEKQALEENRYILEDYIQSNLYKELCRAKKVYREMPFYMDIPYNDTNEKVLVQGVIDLYYISENDEVILVDYKTDKNIAEEKLLERYKFQLNLYKDAIEKSLNKKVDKVYIYSTYLKKEIVID